MNLNNLFKMLDQNSILLIDDSIKSNIIKLKTSYEQTNKSISLFKVMTYQEFINQVSFDVKSNFVIEKMIQDKLPISIIHEKLKFAQYNFKTFDDLTLFVESNPSLIIENKDFYPFIKNKMIHLLEEPIFIKRFLTLFDIQYQIHESIYENIPKVLKFSHKQHEMLYLFEHLFKLIQKGVEPKEIYISNVNSDSIKIMKRFNQSYKIPINYNEKIKINDLSLTKGLLKLDFFNLVKILNNPEDLKVRFEKEFLADSDLFNEVIKKIVNVLNKYSHHYDKNDLYKLIKFDLKNEYITKDNYENAINIVSLEEVLFIKSPHIIIINAIYEQFPSLTKDNAYLSDKDKVIIGYPSSKDVNVFNYKSVKKLIHYPNISYISYAIKDNYKTFSGSDIIVDFVELIPNSSDPKKYVQKISDLSIGDLTHNYALDIYKDIFKNKKDGLKLITFNPEFNMDKISKEKLAQYIKKISLKFSPTSLITYLKSPFIYYIKDILQISDFETNISVKVGNFFHLLVESMYKISFSDVVEVEKSMFENQLIDEYITSHIKTTLDLDHHFEKIKAIYFENELNLIQVLKENESYITLDKKLAIETIFFIDKNKVRMINALNHLLETENTYKASKLIIEKDLYSRNLKGRADLIRIDSESKGYFSIIDFKSGAKATLNAQNLLEMLKLLDNDFESSLNIQELNLLQLLIYAYMLTNEDKNLKMRDLAYFSFLENDLRFNSMQTKDLDKSLYKDKNRKIEEEMFDELMEYLELILEEIQGQIKKINFDINIRKSNDFSKNLKVDEFNNYQAIAFFSKYELDFDQEDTDEDN